VTASGGLALRGGKVDRINHRRKVRLEVMAAAFAEFAETLSDAGVDLNDPSSLSSTEAQSAIAAAGEAFSSPEVQEASENMSEYLEEVCEG